MKSILYYIIGLLVCCMLAASCEEYPEPVDFGKENQLRTTPATNITRLSATVTGEATLSSTPTELGFLVSTSSSMADAKNYRVSTKNGSIQCEITGLTGGTTYYYCVYASSGINTLRSATNSFTTTSYSSPVVGSALSSGSTETTITISATITDKGGADIQEIGFQYIAVDEETTNPSFEGAASIECKLTDDIRKATGTGNLIATTLTNLEPDTKYAIRAYCRNSQGTGTSSVPTFVKTKQLELPQLSAVTVDAISVNSAQAAASFISLGKYDITECGVVCSKNIFSVWNEDLEQFKRTSSAQNNKIAVFINMLEEETTYYVCAYATTKDYGTIIGEVSTFTTATHFSITPEEYTFPEEGGTATFKVNAYHATIDIESEGNWFTAKYDKDAQNITVVAKENTGSSPHGTIKVTATMEDKTVETKTIDLYQTASSKIFKVDTTPVSLPCTASADTIQVTASVAWTAKTDAKWLKIEPASGSTDADVKISAAAYYEGKDRTATIVFGSQDRGSYEVTVTQAKREYYFHTDESSFSLDCNGATKEIKVSTTDKWKATVDQTWVKISQTTGDTDATIKVTIDDNYDTSDRSATIKFETEKSGMKSITIKQKARTYTFTCTTTELSFVEDGGTSSFELKADDSWTATSSESWLTLDKSKGSEGSTIKATAASNKGGFARTATITLASAHDAKIVITAAQAGIGTTLATNSDTIYNVDVKGQVVKLNIQSNTKWEVDVPEGSSWCSVSSANGDGNGTITVTLSEYKEFGSKREAEVRVKSGEKVLYFEFTQDSPALIFSLDKKEVSVSSLSDGQYSVELTANCKWVATENEDWLFIRYRNSNNDGWNGTSRLEGKNSTTFYFYVYSADVNTTRTGKITIKASDGTELVLSITQSPKTTIGREEYDDDVIYN